MAKRSGAIICSSFLCKRKIYKYNTKMWKGVFRALQIKEQRAGNKVPTPYNILFCYISILKMPNTV